MRAVIGAILILAASVPVAAGIIAEAVSQGRYGTPGYVLGVLIGIVGLVALASGALKRAWDAVPVDENKPKPTG